MTTKALANVTEQLAAMAKKASQVEKPTGSTIGVRAGVLSYNGTAVQNNKLDVIVVASTHANLFYEGEFDPNNLANPVCWAYSDDGENMVPSAASTKRQADSCAECPQNKWGSDPKPGSKGKACKNVRALGLIHASTKAEDIPTAEIAVLKLPVMSVKNWQNYVQKCTALHNRPPLGVLTQIGTVPDQKSQFRITFQDLGLVELANIGALIDRVDAAAELLKKDYEANAEPGEAKPANKKF
jgi:hypothetical protein